MTHDSPFSRARFEYERTHLYFLPENILEMLEKEKPVFLIGSRGTGKTTLLHALNWKERLDNPSLRNALGDKGLDTRYIGVYLRMPIFNMASFEEWLQDVPYIYGPLFAFYVDLISAELLTDAIAELLARGVLKAPITREKELINRLMDEHSNVPIRSAELPAQTLKSFSAVLCKIRRKLQWHSQIKTPPSELPEMFMVNQFGEFGRAISNLLVEFCDASSANSEIGWHFKICMDEAEYLSPFQRLVINSLMRLTQSALFHVVSYVRHPEDLSTTLLPGMSLQKADTQIIPLDDVSNSDFKTLVEGVATVRVRAKLKDPHIHFSTSHVLGKLDLNAILKEILEESETPLSKALLRKAERIQSTFEKLQISYSGSLPIFQAYLIDELSLGSDELFSTERLERRKIQSKQFRKKMVAAYLHLCRRLNTKVRYAQDRMIFGMSDNCIRDYLAQLHEIFLEVSMPLKDFVSFHNIPINKQNKALKRASEQKRDSLPKRVNSPDRTGKLVNGLARITAIIQSSNAALKSSEIGLFVISIRGSTSNDISSLIKQASEAGFLYVKRYDPNKLSFRVHCSLAAAFNFSYRGSYYECHISANDINALITSQDEDQLDKIVKRISKRISEEHFGQTVLF